MSQFRDLFRVGRNDLFRGVDRNDDWICLGLMTEVMTGTFSWAAAACAAPLTAAVKEELGS